MLLILSHVSSAKNFQQQAMERQSIPINVSCDVASLRDENECQLNEDDDPHLLCKVTISVEGSLDTLLGPNH